MESDEEPQAPAKRLKSANAKAASWAHEVQTPHSNTSHDEDSHGVKLYAWGYMPCSSPI